MHPILAVQLAIDYCCGAADVADAENHFAVWKPLDGRRRYSADGECPLKIAAVGGKLLCCGQADILEAVWQILGGCGGAWSMEPRRLIGIEAALAPFGCRIRMAHPFYIAPEKTAVPAGDFETVWYAREGIRQFQGDARFDEAFAFLAEAPDELAVAAYRDGRLLGMAGASSDSPRMWQIGINVLPQAEGQGIGAALVAQLKNALLDRGVLPYYGTAMSHIASQRVAGKAGFLPAWAELTGERVTS